MIDNIKDISCSIQGEAYFKVQNNFTGAWDKNTPMHSLSCLINLNGNFEIVRHEYVLSTTIRVVIIKGILLFIPQWFCMSLIYTYRTLSPGK